MPPGRICVVHLVRRCNGKEPLERFVSAYSKNEAGIEHRLLVLFKGFQNPDDVAEYRSRLSGIQFRELLVPDHGYDVGSYACAFATFHTEYQYYCFLNSYSEPLHPGWLALLYRHACEPGVGLVGATGSYESLSSSVEYQTYVLARMLRRGRAINPVERALVRPILTLIRLKRLLSFPHFPNPHIRTNGFLLPSCVMKAIRVPRLRSKMDAYRFESGRSGLTRQVLQMGKKVLLVGANGIGYGIDDWYRSNTFRRSDQENLLIADNQTRAYRDEDMRKKVMLSHYAWRDNAWPNISVLSSAFRNRAQPETR